MTDYSATANESQSPSTSQDPITIHYVSGIHLFQKRLCVEHQMVNRERQLHDRKGAWLCHYNVPISKARVNIVHKFET